MKNVWLMVVALTLVGGIQTVSAEEPAPMTPVMISIMTPVQGPTPEWDVKGFRLDILYGRCHNMYGLDIGGVANHATGKEVGLAASFVLNYSEKEFTGLQVAAVNVSSKVKALQIGVYNEADDMTGLQIGLINHTRLMEGCQIGLINVIDRSDFPFLPVINFLF